MSEIDKCDYTGYFIFDHASNIFVLLLPSTILHYK